MVMESAMPPVWRPDPRLWAPSPEVAGWFSVSTILSIQSSVAFGHVGNSAATFPLMRMGVEVFPVLTVHYSNSTVYGSWYGPVHKAAEVADIVKGIDERGALAGVDAVLTGYQGSEEMGNAILGAVELVRERNPQAIYCCDPVMGDVGRGFYVAPGIPEFLRDRVIPAADIVVPNQFELDFLTGRETTTLAGLLDAADALRATGPDIVLVTSAVTDDAGDDQISMLVVSDEAHLVTTPRFDRSFTGSGDLTAATFLASILAGKSLADALARTANVVYSVLKVTAAAGTQELQLVAAQDELVNPTASFTAVQVR